MILEEWIPRAQSELSFPALLIQKDGQRRRRTGQESVEDHFQVPFDFFNGAEEVLMKLSSLLRGTSPTTRSRHSQSTIVPCSSAPSGNRLASDPGAADLRGLQASCSTT